MKKIHNKASILSLEVLVGLILVLVFIFLLTFFTVDSTQKAIDKTERDLCLASVKRAESLRILKGDSIVPIDCRTRFIEIKEGTKKPKRKGNQFTYEINNKKDLMKVFADEMAGCWYQMGSGNVNMFGNFDGDKRCVICSEISIDPKMAAKYKSVGLDEDTFNDFLTDNKFSTPIFPEGYSKVLKIEEGVVGAGEVGGQKSFPNIKIADAGGAIPYSVIFSIYNYNQMFGIVGGSAAGSTLGSALICAGGALIAIKTIGLGVPVAIIACSGVTAGGAAIGTSAGLIYNSAREDERGNQYFPAWYVKPAADALEAGCSQLY